VRYIEGKKSGSLTLVKAFRERKKHISEEKGTSTRTLRTCLASSSPKNSFIMSCQWRPP